MLPSLPLQKYMQCTHTHRHTLTDCATGRDNLVFLISRDFSVVLCRPITSVHLTLKESPKLLPARYSPFSELFCDNEAISCPAPSSRMLLLDSTSFSSVSLCRTSSAKL